jgi:hypothetical protein
MFTSFIPIIILIQIQKIKNDLPSVGKFVILKFNDSTCKTLDNVRLNDPSSKCWSTSYDNGIKPISYTSNSKSLNIKTYTTNSCYGNDFKSFELNCDHKTCNSINFNGNNKYILCSYVAFPSLANFTINRYYDKECQFQTGISVLKGNSHCWKLNNKNSITPVMFDMNNLEDLNIYSYNNPDCSGTISNLKSVKCDNSCFEIDNSDEYYRCTYMYSHYFNFWYFLYFLILVIF